jgi:hypothetical protein
MGGGTQQALLLAGPDKSISPCWPHAIGKPSKGWRSVWTTRQTPFGAHSSAPVEKAKHHKRPVTCKFFTYVTNVSNKPFAVREMLKNWIE